MMKSQTLKDPESMTFFCNRCNLARPATVHPCPNCRCLEYRIVRGPAPAPAAPVVESQPLLRGFDT